MSIFVVQLVFHAAESSASALNLATETQCYTSRHMRFEASSASGKSRESVWL
jgi:hypothetical protein